MGLRPYRVFVVKTQWTGDTRGEGAERIIQETELIPTPKLDGWDGVALSADIEGRVENGSVNAIVSARYTDSDLLPSCRDNEEIFWDVVDTKTDVRRRFFPEAVPSNEGVTKRIVKLSRQEADRDKEGRLSEMVPWVPKA